ncbi:MAG: hypothetical protein GXP31_01045 [Kiritimatiellaeota bacterium]|nr:hypothetical protein [Kiritimatiellota bacterium]
MTSMLTALDFLIAVGGAGSDDTMDEVWPDEFMNFVAMGRSLHGFKSLRRTPGKALLKHRLGR